MLAVQHQRVFFMSAIFEFFDLPIQKFFAQFVGRSDFFDRTIYAFSEYDTFKGGILFALLWFVWFQKPAGETSMAEAARRAKLLVIFWGSVFSVCIARLLQVLLHIHNRPFISHLDVRFPSIMNEAKFNEWNSFPSDHAVYFFALAVGLWSLNKRVGLFACVWTVLIVCLPRIYLGVHYPSDLVAGVVLGVLMMRALLLSRRLEDMARWVLKYEQRYAGLFYGFAFFTTLSAASLFDDIRGICKGIAVFIKNVFWGG